MNIRSFVVTETEKVEGLPKREILFPKTNPITVGIIYRPPNQSNSLQIVNENLAKLHTLKKELLILGHFNKKLENESHARNKSYILESGAVSNNVKNYLQFCTMFGLTKIIKSPTGTCSSTSLSVPERISEEGVITFGLLDHQLIYCNGKISRIKTRGVQKKTSFRSLKNYDGRCLQKRSEQNKFSEP